MPVGQKGCINIERSRNVLCSIKSGGDFFDAPILHSVDIEVKYSAVDIL